MRAWRPAIIQGSSPWRALIGALAVLALAAIVLGSVIRLSAPPASAAQQLVGHPAPAVALHAEQGGRPLPVSISLAPAHGHPTLVLFFFSLCPRCHSDVLAVAQIERAYATRGLRVLYVNSPAESIAIADAYAARMGVTAPLLLDPDGRVASSFGVQYYPGIVLLDERGIVRAAWTGEAPPSTLSQAVAALLPA